MNLKARHADFWGAHAPRVLISAPSPKSSLGQEEALNEKFAIARARSPAREARALPK